MAYSAVAVANAFIAKAKAGEIKNLTPMKLQKLLFYTQSWHLKLNNKQPLFDDQFARWKFGPVIPYVYHDLKKYGSSEISDYMKTIRIEGNKIKALTPTIQEDDTKAKDLINKIVEVYGKYSGTELSNFTHGPNTAWSKGDVDGGPISYEDMAEHIH